MFMGCLVITSERRHYSSYKIGINTIVKGNNMAVFQKIVLYIVLVPTSLLTGMMVVAVFGLWGFLLIPIPFRLYNRYTENSLQH